MSKHLWVSVKEVFFEDFVIEEVLFIAAQQGVGIFLQGVLPCLEPPPAHIHYHLLVLSLPDANMLWWRWEGVASYGHPAYRSCPGEG